MALLIPNARRRYLALALAMTAGCTQLLPADQVAQDASEDAPDDGDVTLTCTPSITSVDYSVIAHGASLKIEGTCLGTATSVRLAGTAQPFTVEGPGELRVTAVDDGTPLGPASLEAQMPDGTASAVGLTVIHLTIDELDAATPPGSTNRRQFVELGTGLTTDVSLAGYAVALIDGSTDATYPASQSAPLGLAPSGRYLLANAMVLSGGQQPFPDSLLAPSTDAHLVVIVQTTESIAGNVPLAGVPGTLIDALVFSRADAPNDDALLAYAYPNVADRVQQSETAGGAIANNNSVRRCGDTTRRSGAAFGLGAPTPGATNCP